MNTVTPSRTASITRRLANVRQQQHSDRTEYLALSEQLLGAPDDAALLAAESALATRMAASSAVAAQLEAQLTESEDEDRRTATQRRRNEGLKRVAGVIKTHESRRPGYAALDAASDAFMAELQRFLAAGAQHRDEAAKVAHALSDGRTDRIGPAVDAAGGTSSAVVDAAAAHIHRVMRAIGYAALQNHFEPNHHVRTSRTFAEAGDIDARTLEARLS